METQEIREKLHHFIEAIEDKKVEAMYALFEDQIEEDGFLLTNEQYKVLEEERERHLVGQSASYTWQQVQDQIKAKATEPNV